MIGRLLKETNEIKTAQLLTNNVIEEISPNVPSTKRVTNTVGTKASDVLTELPVPKIIVKLGESGTINTQGLRAHGVRGVWSFGSAALWIDIPLPTQLEVPG